MKSNLNDLKGISTEVKNLYDCFSKLTIHLEKIISEQQPSVSNGKEILTVKEASKYLRSSETFVRDAARSKGLPHIRIGSRTLIDKAELDKWLVTKTIQSNY